MATDAMAVFQVKAGEPVDLKITVDYGQPGTSEVKEPRLLLLLPLPPPSPPTPRQPNPMTKRLADSGETLRGKVVGCLTAVTVTNHATLKTGVTYELTGVISGPTPVILQEDATAINESIIYTVSFGFYV